MISTGDIEAWISRAREGDWSWFTAQPGMNEDQIAALRRHAEAKKERVAAAWARFAASEDGAEALQQLADQTLNRAVPPSVATGLSMEQVAMYAQFREGQNNVVHGLIRLIALARNPGDQPPNREN